MIVRDIDKQYGEHASLYKDLFAKAAEEFKERIDSFSVFHTILIDRVVDSYIQLLMADKVDHADKKGGKDFQERLQKWLSLSFGELHSLANETTSRKMFYKQISDVINDKVQDSITKKMIFAAILEVMKKNKAEIL